MCYVIIMIYFMFYVIKDLEYSIHRGDSTHLCYPDADTGGRSTLVLEF